MPLTFEWPRERPHFARVVRVVDGDTLRCDIDEDFKDWKHDYPVRLAGCNSHETQSYRCPCGFGPSTGAHEPGLAAKAKLTELLPPGTLLILASIKDYKFGGEFVARIFLEADGTDVIAELIAGQWVAPWDGNGTPPTPPWPRTV